MAQKQCIRCGKTASATIPVKFKTMTHGCILTKIIHRVDLCNGCLVRLRDPGHPLFNLKILQSMASEQWAASGRVIKSQRVNRAIPAKAYL